jgi:cytochrome c oxidase cbb3-type subunit 3
MSWSYARAGLTAAGVVLILALGFGAEAYHRQSMDARLLRSFADANPGDPELVRWAVSRATPVYKSRCASCHGADMTGDPKIGAANLVDSDWLFGTGRVGEIEQTILYGIRSGDIRSKNQADMPAFARAKPYKRYAIPTLSDAEIDSVADYVLSLQGRPAPAASIEAGKALYRDRAQCFDCHENDAKGDSFIGSPNLTDKVWLYGDGSFASFKKSVAHGRAGVCPAWFDKLKPAVIRALAVLIHQRAAPANPEGKAS